MLISALFSSSGASMNINKLKDQIGRVHVTSQWPQEPTVWHLSGADVNSVMKTIGTMKKKNVYSGKVLI